MNRTASVAKRARAKRAPRLPQPKNLSEPVWRYTDLAKYVDLLARRKLYMCRVDSFQDPFEATLPQAQGCTGSRRLRWLRQARRSTYVSCWRLGRDESEAMWRLYCGNAGGVAIMLPYAKLVHSARQTGCEIGLVRYIDYGKQRFPDSGDILHASMLKRIAFAHEREVRMVRRLRSPSSRGTPPAGIDIDWDCETWVERVVLSPLSERYFCEAVHKVTEALAPALMPRFESSQMQGTPNV